MEYKKELTTEEEAVINCYKDYSAKDVCEKFGFSKARLLRIVGKNKIWQAWKNKVTVNLTLSIIKEDDYWNSVYQVFLGETKLFDCHSDEMAKMLIANTLRTEGGA